MLIPFWAEGLTLAVLAQDAKTVDPAFLGLNPDPQSGVIPIAVFPPAPPTDRRPQAPLEVIMLSIESEETERPRQETERQLGRPHRIQWPRPVTQKGPLHEAQDISRVEAF